MPPINVLNKISQSNILLELQTALQHILFTGFVCHMLHNVNYFLFVLIVQYYDKSLLKRPKLFLSANDIFESSTSHIPVLEAGVHKRIQKKGYLMFYSFVKIGCYLAQGMLFLLEMIDFLFHFWHKWNKIIVSHYKPDLWWFICL